MLRTATKALFAFCLVLPAQAQIPPGWTEMDCARSMLGFGDSFPCAERRGEDIGRAYATAYLTMGRVQRISIWLAVDYVTGDSWLQVYTSESAHEVLRRFGGVSDPTELRQSGVTSYIVYDRRGASCIAFDQPGPFYQYGYKWILRGLICVPADQGASFELARAVLAATRVGPLSAARNALGEPIAAFASPLR